MQPASILLYCLGALLAALAIYVFSKDRQVARHDSANTKDDTLIVLLRNGIVADANFAASRILQTVSGPDQDIERLRLYLSRHFDNSEDLIALPDKVGELKAASRDGQTQIHREITADTVRLKMCFVSAANPLSDDTHSLRAMESELETLRANTSAAPFLLWRQNPSGEIVWVNQSYLDTIRKVNGDDCELTWPLPALFPSLRPAIESGDGEPLRLAIQGKGDDESAWYDCHVTNVGQDVLCTAIPADEAVRAENRRREFTQTLTKTFAELAIGLAIFDRSRRLVLFNPALLDLTSLPTDFLTSRPSMVAFLDRLRENRVMPEPRDYRAWRTSIAELEAAAADGTYSETWSLPDGQTYHVTGRPHPDGAVALLFEDISAEMSLTRRFRAELEQSQTVLDAMDDAVAVFSPAGQLVLTNDAYRELWDSDPDSSLAATDLIEATRQWHALSAPTPVWGDFRDFAQMAKDREEWSATISLLDGRSLYCRFIPQKAGASMAIFQIQTAQAVPRQELRQAG